LTGSYLGDPHLFTEQTSCAGEKKTIREETCTGTGSFNLMVAPKFKVVAIQDLGYYPVTSASSIGAVKLNNLQPGGGELTFSSSNWPTSGAGFTFGSIGAKTIVTLTGSDFYLTVTPYTYGAKFHIDISFSSGELDQSSSQIALLGCGPNLISGRRLLDGITDLPICASLDEPFKTFCNVDMAGIDDPDLATQIVSAMLNSSQTYQETTNRTINSILSSGGKLVTSSQVLVSVMCFICGMLMF
jgi:hypothetical protein